MSCHFGAGLMGCDSGVKSQKNSVQVPLWPLREKNSMGGCKLEGIEVSLFGALVVWIWIKG